RPHRQRPPAAERPEGRGALPRRRRAVEVALRLEPAPTRGEPARRPRVEVALLEVDAAEAPGDSRLRGGRREGRPDERHVSRGDEPGLDPRASGREPDRAPEAV